MIHRQQKMQGTLIVEFRQFVPTRKNPASFIDSELSPYADAYEEITDQAFSSYKNADEINRQLVHLGRLDNFDWQPPAIEVIAKRRGDPDFILRFLADLERLAYGLFLMRSDPSDRIRRYGRLLGAIQTGEDLFVIESPLQLDDDERKAVRKTLDCDIYTITRIRLPLLLRLDELLSGGSATYTHNIVSVEHVLPQNPSSGSQWLVDFPDGNRIVTRGFTSWAIPFFSPAARIRRRAIWILPRRSRNIFRPRQVCRILHLQAKC